MQLRISRLIWAKAMSQRRSPGAGWGSVPRLDNLDARLNFAAQYTIFSDDDMQEIYDGLPLATVGISFQATTSIRTFISVGYGRATGDPYVERESFSAPDGSTIRTVPVQLGLKADLAHSQRLRLNFGTAIELAWMSETVPTTDNQGQPGEQTLSDVNAGYQVTFGPEVMLGHCGSSVGFEFGWGGSKGSVWNGNRRHGVSLTGYQGRVYFALAL